MPEDYYSKINPGDVWLFPKVSSQKQRRYYDKESLIHPAKMPTFLVQKIIKEYSKPGDLVLDPMAGIGTTLIEAILLGRNAVGVEYEEKFVKIIERNLKCVEAFRRIGKTPLGHAVVLQGDSRQLSGVLKENAGKIDTIFTSPPYGHRSTKRDPKTNPHQNETLKIAGAGHSKEAHYSDSKENIGNLSYSPERVDAIVGSPPYSDISLKTGVDLKGRIHGRMFGDKRKFTKSDYKNVLLHDRIDEAKGLQYSKDKKNIGCLPHGEIDAIVTSPPYSEALNPKKNTGSEMKYSEDKQNPSQIGSLPHGSVDTVVTSPPFVSANEGGGLAKSREHSDGHDLSKNAGKLSEDKENIDNKKNYGEADAIVSSPPYADMVKSKPKTAEEVKKAYERCLKAGHSKAAEHYKVFLDNPTLITGDNFAQDFLYSEEKENLGNLSGETYLEAMLKVYRECFTILKEGGNMALVTKNFVRKGKMVRLDLDTIKLCEAAGFIFKERKYRKLDTVSFWIRNARKKYYKANPTKVTGDPYAEYEDVLVFEKGG